MKLKVALGLLALYAMLLPPVARADELYMINDGQGQANFDSESNSPGGYDLAGYRYGSIQVTGVGGTAFGTVSIQWRNTKNDDWREIGFFADPGPCTAKTCEGIYGPAAGYVKAVLTYSGPGTFRVTLRRQ